MLLLHSSASRLRVASRRALSSVAAARRDALLFTPGPLTTSLATKAAMLRDVGSRDAAFLRVVAEVRERLLALGGVSAVAAAPSLPSPSPSPSPSLILSPPPPPSPSAAAYECVITQGSGTFGVESVLGSAVPRRERGGRLLVASNGAYGERMAKIARVLDIDVAVAAFPERGPVDVAAVAARVREARAAEGRPFSHVAVVHHETTAGVLNDVPALGAALAAADPRCALIVDSMSAFGAYPLDLRAANVAFLVSSSNKCIEGVPGFSFALCERTQLEQCGAPGQARSLALDLHAQWAGLHATGEFRFTPPVQALLAFRQALAELEAEGGPPGRLARYEANARALVRGMGALGFAPYVPAPHQGCIITTFLVPDDRRFVFRDVYAALERRGFVIYPGKTTKAESFRLGSIGRLFPEDVDALVAAFADVLRQAGVRLPVQQKRED